MSGYISIIGTDGDDVIVGQTAATWIDGGLGNDVITGQDAGDVIYGNSGNDTLSGNGGDDTLYGGAGDDTLTSGAGGDQLYGGEGNDRLYGSEGDLSWDGGEGDDYLYLTPFSQGVTLDLTADTMISGNTTASLNSLENVVGTSFDDVIFVEEETGFVNGYGGNDELHGTASSDVLIGGFGSDTVFGYGGNDILYGDETGGNVLDAGAGDDLFAAGYITGSNGYYLDLNSDQIQYYSASGSLLGTDQAYNFESAVSSYGNDQFNGDSGDNRYLMYKNSWGADIFNGGDGSDTLEFHLVGLQGTDGISVSLADGAGSYTHSSLGSITYTGIENLVGSEADDILVGDGNNNVFYTLGTRNILEAGWRSSYVTGNDSYDGGAGSDTISFTRSDVAVTASLEGPIALSTSETLTFSNIENLEGSDFDDVLTGDAGNNTLEGGLGNDVLNGQAGNDTLYGGSGSDVLNGGAEDDQLYGEAGSDQFYGGAGNDTFWVDEHDTVFDGGEGGMDSLRLVNVQSSSVINLSDDVKTLSDGSTIAAHTIQFGSNQASVTDVEVVIGSEQSETIYVAEGTSAVNAQGGDDELHGTASSDVLIGGFGSDTVFGYGGNDILYGDETGGNVLDAGAGDDLFAAGYITGSNGYYLDLNSDQIQYYSASGSLLGTDQAYNFESAVSSYGNDQFNGDSGDNRYLMYKNSWGADIFNGGDGSDTLEFHLVGLQGTDGISVSLADGAGSYTHSSLGSITYTGIENLVGSEADDILVGDGNNNVFYTLGTRNILEAGWRSSYVTGNDSYDGGAGSDTISFTRSDVAVTASLEGPIALSTSETLTFSNVENLEGSDFGDVLTGDVGNNTLKGGLGNDTLEGGDGADVLNGGAGADYIEGGLGDDTIEGSAGTDLIDGGFGTDLLDFSGFGSAISVNLDIYDKTKGSVTYTAATAVVDGDNQQLNSIESVQGSDYDDVIFGTYTADKLSGGAGDDYLYGANGTDTLYGEAGNDTLVGGNHEDVLYGGDGNDRLSANTANDSLYGEAGDDILNGQKGDDTLDGGIGSDLLTGGEGSDKFVFGTGYGADTITDFTVGEDWIDLSQVTSLSSFQEVLLLATDQGADVYVDFGNGDSLTLEDIQIANLDSSDFYFG